MSAVKDEGYNAYWEGVDREENPYEQGTAEHTEWDLGFGDAEFDDGEVDPYFEYDDDPYNFDDEDDGA